MNQKPWRIADCEYKLNFPDLKIVCPSKHYTSILLMLEGFLHLKRCLITIIREIEFNTTLTYPYIVARVLKNSKTYSTKSLARRSRKWNP
jgi:hypothetical protein